MIVLVYLFHTNSASVTDQRWLDPILRTGIGPILVKITRSDIAKKKKTHNQYDPITKSKCST